MSISYVYPRAFLFLGAESCPSTSEPRSSKTWLIIICQDTKLNRRGNISALLPLYWGPDIGPVQRKACGKTRSVGHLGQQMRQRKGQISQPLHTVCGGQGGGRGDCHPEISQPKRWRRCFPGVTALLPVLTSWLQPVSSGTPPEPSLRLSHHRPSIRHSGKSDRWSAGGRV